MWIGWRLARGADRTHFSLLDDGGLAFAQVEIVLTPGILGPISPSAGLLQAPFWQTPPGWVHSVSGTSGIGFYTQPLTWDGGQQALSLEAGVNGESGFAFFHLASGGSPVTKVIFDIPSGYNAGVGDTLEFAFSARPVPEPGTLAFVAQGLAAMNCARRFQRRNPEM